MLSALSIFLIRSRPVSMVHSLMMFEREFDALTRPSSERIGTLQVRWTDSRAQVLRGRGQQETMRTATWMTILFIVAAALDSLRAVHAQNLHHAAMPNRIHINWVNETGGESPCC